MFCFVILGLMHSLISPLPNTIQILLPQRCLIHSKGTTKTLHQPELISTAVLKIQVSHGEIKAKKYLVI